MKDRSRQTKQTAKQTGVDADRATPHADGAQRWHVQNTIADRPCKHSKQHRPCTHASSRRCMPRNGCTQCCWEVTTEGHRFALLSHGSGQQLMLHVSEINLKGWDHKFTTQKPRRHARRSKTRKDGRCTLQQDQDTRRMFEQPPVYLPTVMHMRSVCDMASPTHLRSCCLCFMSDYLNRHTKHQVMPHHAKRSDPHSLALPRRSTPRTAPHTKKAPHPTKPCTAPHQTPTTPYDCSVLSHR